VAESKLPTLQPALRRSRGLFAKCGYQWALMMGTLHVKVPPSSSIHERSGLNRDRESIDFAARLDILQRAGDELMWKFIISPKFGDRVDLKRLTHELMARIEHDLGRSRLERIAVEHYNTEPPHIHVAVRGVDGQGQRFVFGREYLKRGIRTIAEVICSQRLG